MIIYGQAREPDIGLTQLGRLSCLLLEHLREREVCSNSLQSNAMSALFGLPTITDRRCQHNIQFICFKLSMNVLTDPLLVVAAFAEAPERQMERNQLPQQALVVLELQSIARPRLQV
jgi:hypothetical protein